jgi:transcriptional regulator with XRE-family HTH domain
MGRPFQPVSPNTGGVLAALRKQAGLSLRALASRSGFSPSYLCDIEWGRRRATDKVIAAYRDLPQPAAESKEEPA